MEAAIGIEPMDKGFADLCLTTWLRRLNCQTKGEGHSCRLLEFGLRLEPWSGRRDLNPRLRPWQGRTLPLSYSRSANLILSAQNSFCQPEALFAARKALFARGLIRLSELQLHHKRILGGQTIVLTPPAHDVEPEIPI